MQFSELIFSRIKKNKKKNNQNIFKKKRYEARMLWREKNTNE